MKPSSPTLFAALACLVVAVAGVSGMVLVGGPGQARDYRLDDQRIEALRGLSNAVERYRRDQGALPATLDALAKDQDGITPTAMRDPETGRPYEYRVTAVSRFELCGVFTTASREEEAIRWRHPAGQACFSTAV